MRWRLKITENTHTNYLKWVEITTAVWFSILSDWLFSFFVAVSYTIYAHIERDKNQTEKLD